MVSTIGFQIIQFQDRLVLRTKKPVKVSKRQYNYILYKDTQSAMSIPLLIDEKQQAFAKQLATLVEVTQYTSIAGGIFMSLLFRVFIYSVWSFLNDLSTLTNLSMISIAVPGIAHYIQSFILSLTYLDIKGLYR
ncbi:hypothetical protein FGO68_gene9419 [Halteria grandinella]|uniref:Uncharacterized protein n=1 Tax=Halteria grandinella TaxID=5974 RepID=A0A8J8P3B7_HALGN|nr:hypothetical protein FGO68_gene9419 [Halteria grandinella]